ncbi:hypothetical protein J437_LFUL017611 [Ladona fulva]|uniref:Uncharacterized protein n=1 Tax=Ladona fulva TaxID=123851 RepID=A0A8K0KMW9_LADFU|nr:hypothetical protein J437_LFUL017611 [Ladona fulva]
MRRIFIDSSKLKAWPQRNTYSPGKLSVANKSLVNPQNVFLSRLHIKHGLMMIFVKAMDRELRRHINCILIVLLVSKITILHLYRMLNPYCYFNRMVERKTPSHAVRCSYVLLPLPHYEGLPLDLMKNFVKALDNGGHVFDHLKEKFPELSEAKLKECIFVGLQIRKLLKDSTVYTKLTNIEYASWPSFKAIIKGILNNRKDCNYVSIVNDLLDSY